MTERSVHKFSEVTTQPESISSSTTPNFCGLELLKEDWSSKQAGRQADSVVDRSGPDPTFRAHNRTEIDNQSGWGANNPPGIEGWANETQLGIFHANQALGLDPFDSTSKIQVNNWTAQRSIEVGQQLRQRYQLPESATKADVVNAAVDHRQADRYCAASQATLDKEQAYDGMVADLVTSELVERYRARFSKPD